ncbi:hypothetical protein KC866_02365 [Patescibacteria group bacterium]|nr:hypothetical protein [Patescibacteria group bacterium]
MKSINEEEYKHETTEIYERLKKLFLTISKEDLKPIGKPFITLDLYDLEAIADKRSLAYISDEDVKKMQQWFQVRRRIFGITVWKFKKLFKETSLNRKKLIQKLIQEKKDNIRERAFKLINLQTGTVVEL